MSNKELTTDKDGIVTERRVNVAATLRQIRPGEERRFDRKKLCAEGTLRTTIIRANAMAGRAEYTLEVDQRSDVFVVSRAPATAPRPLAHRGRRKQT